ncbi:MAG: deoxyguanosinetriphosphate triphosphohydrolase [Phycisphaerae bacterium]|nr:deoxyguanosinetriphosphate triphosphohydrolase [Phycisphaerae bacterium]
MSKYISNITDQWLYESSHLASYAVHAEYSKGRSYKEDRHLFRTCFQRDRDRIIHCAAFRRLEAKTQVFMLVEHDYYRTRLTHTIEVAQIARTLARILKVNEDLAEAAALAHDLGHPPYGHCGEEVLNELMQGHGGFEHNLQSLRTVEYLEHPYPNFRGLNLSYETRECLAKHETRFDNPEQNDEFGDGKGTIEGQIADLADSIAYNSHDLDDALACGLITEQDLDQIELYQQIKETVQKLYPEAHRHARQLRCAKAIIDTLVRDVLKHASAQLTEINPQSVDDVRNAPAKIVGLSTEKQALLNHLSDFLMQNVYCSTEVMQGQKQAKHEISELFNLFLTSPDLMPNRYQKRLEEQPLHRVICDYIAGMTDRYSHKLFQQLLN